MELEYKSVEDFQFLKIDEAYFADKPLKAKGISDNYRLALNLIDETVINAEQTCLIYENDKLIYAGYYSESFKKRWLRKQKKIYYVCHSANIDDHVNECLNEKTVSVWLSVNPYAKTDENISKVIEDTIIMKLTPIKKKIGKYLEENKQGSITINQIIARIELMKKVRRIEKSTIVFSSRHHRPGLKNYVEE